jgi:hypothetical protein
MLRQTSRLDFSHRTKQKNSHKRVRKWVVLQFNWNIPFNNGLPTYVISLITTDIHLQYTFPIQKLLTSDCLSCHDSQHMLQMPSTWNSTRVDMSDHGMSLHFKAPGANVKGLTGIKFALVKSLHFQLTLNTLEGLSVPTTKKLKDWDQTNVGAIIRKLFSHK